MNILSHTEKLVDTCFSLLPRVQPNAARAATARLIAHRGAHDKALLIQENTNAAFARALALGCWGIEFDVHACADQTLVVNHDPTLHRLWGKDITIAQSSFDDLRVAAPLLPSLAEVIARFGKRMHLFIELKAPFMAVDALAAALQPLTPTVDYHLLSLDETTFTRLDVFPKEALLLVPVHNNVRKFCQLSLQKKYGGILGHYLLLLNKDIEKLKAANQIAGVGFVDSKYSLYRELNRDLSYFFSNNVATVSACIQALTV